jgi:hypothetical protein
MAISPTDLGDKFVKEGNRLITQPSSDPLLKKARQKAESKGEQNC